MRRSRWVVGFVVWLGLSAGCAVADNGLATVHDSGKRGPIDATGDVPTDAAFDVPSGTEAAPPTADSGPDVPVADTASVDSTVAADSGIDTADTGSGLDTLLAADTPTGPPTACVPVINEVQTAGAGATDEFVEIFNPCGVDIAMSGYKIVYRAHTNVYDATAAHDSATVYAFVAADVLPAAGYFVVGGAGFTGPTDALEPSSGTLASAAGQVGLRDPSGRLIDGVYYGTGATGTPAFLEGTPAPGPAAGSSIYRAPDGTDTNDNGADFSAANPVPTPKAPNPTS